MSLGLRSLSRSLSLDRRGWGDSYSESKGRRAFWPRLFSHFILCLVSLSLSLSLGLKKKHHAETSSLMRHQGP